VLAGRSVLAVVPARRGSVGIPDKNLRTLAGRTLIGWAGATLADCPFVDRRILSTDSETYAEEGGRWGLEVPFLRPAELSTATATAVDVLRHAVVASEAAFDRSFDLVLVVEPTSPLRTPDDVRRVAMLLAGSDADSAVSVSPIDAKCHPWKVLRVDDAGRLTYWCEEGRGIANRAELPGGLVIRNGLCYAVTRRCLMEQGRVIGERTLADVVRRPVANIDEPLDLEWAEFLLQRQRAPDG
jgi:CMP-N-acetylneuraminic acid synthetase